MVVATVSLTELLLLPPPVTTSPRTGRGLGRDLILSFPFPVERVDIPGPAGGGPEVDDDDDALSLPALPPPPPSLEDDAVGSVLDLLDDLPATAEVSVCFCLSILASTSESSLARSHPAPPASLLSSSTVMAAFLAGPIAPTRRRLLSWLKKVAGE